MDKIEKAIRKLSQKERVWIKSVFKRLKAGELAGLDIKKIKGREDIFRIRRGDLRVIYLVNVAGVIVVLKIERRSETTYKF